MIITEFLQNLISCPVFVSRPEGSAAGGAALGRFNLPQTIEIRATASIGPASVGQQKAGHHLAGLLSCCPTLVHEENQRKNGK